MGVVNESVWFTLSLFCQHLLYYLLLYRCGFTLFNKLLNEQLVLLRKVTSLTLQFLNL